MEDLVELSAAFPELFENRSWLRFSPITDLAGFINGIGRLAEQDDGRLARLITSSSLLTAFDLDKQQGWWSARVTFGKGNIRPLAELFRLKSVDMPDPDHTCLDKSVCKKCFDGNELKGLIKNLPRLALGLIEQIVYRLEVLAIAFEEDLARPLRSRWGNDNHYFEYRDCYGYDQVDEENLDEYGSDGSYGYDEGEISARVRLQ